jgi:hypothetical protein
MNRKGYKKKGREREENGHIPGENDSKEPIQLRVNCKHTIDTLRKITVCHYIFIYASMDVTKNIEVSLYSFDAIV